MSIRLVGLSGVLLAGGQSRRMGRDKRFIELGGQTLMKRALSTFEQLFSDILIVVAEVSPPLLEFGHRVVADLIPGCATLGGLYTGLSYAIYPRVFVAACDMPFLNARLIRALAESHQGADIVMARLATGLQPVHAIYSKACLPHLERMIAANQFKLQELVRAPGLAVKLLHEEELRQEDPQLLSFLNINTPADLDAARKLLAARATLSGYNL